MGRQIGRADVHAIDASGQGNVDAIVYIDGYIDRVRERPRNVEYVACRTVFESNLHRCGSAGLGSTALLHEQIIWQGARSNRDEETIYRHGRHMIVRGIRGATVVERDDPSLILTATKELLTRIVEANALDVESIISAIFTVTPDLRSEYPARAARDLGWVTTPLLGAVEMDVPGGLPRCIRVLMHVHSLPSSSEIQHVYLHEARTLRPDL